MSHEWSNWSGSLTFSVNAIENPRDDEDVSRLVRRALDEGRIARVVGAGHSSSPLVKTEDVLISLDRFQGLVHHDRDQCEATIRAGMTVHAAGKAFHEVGLALPNTGDVDVQTLVGAVGTGTHGTGKRLQNLAAVLIGARMVTGTGEIVEKRIEDDPAFFQAARVSLGALGIMTEIRVRLVPTYQLHRREQCTTIDTCLERLDDLTERNRNFDFYWYPRSDEAKLRTMNELNNDHEKESIDIPDGVLTLEKIGWSHDVLPRQRELKFDEMEYVLPAEAGPACFREVRERVKAKHRRHVAWRVLYRTIAADDAYLSPMAGRDSVAISLHQNNTLPFWAYFMDMEPIFRAYGGRPHWGKKHTLRAADLRPLYPEWDAFLATREQMDPHGVFLNPYLRDLLINT